MALTPDFPNKLILSDASITDIVTFHEALRDIEDSDEGMLNPPIHAYKRVDLGGGAYFHDVPFINGWQLKFPVAGNYTIIGNIGANVVPVAGVFVDRTKSAAFSTTSSGGSGPTASSIADAVWTKALEGLTAEEMMRVMLAALAGKRQGIGSATEQYMGQDGVTPRITLTPDVNGNGTPVIDGTP
jgi:hypothetical protein